MTVTLKPTLNATAMHFLFVAHCGGNLPDHERADSHEQKAMRSLMVYDLIEVKDDTWKLTARGIAYVHALIRTPLPIERTTFHDPRDNTLLISELP